MNKQHRDLIRSFIEYKDRAEKKLIGTQKMMNDVAYLEQMVALKTPCMQAEHVIGDASALSLYDCLVPKLREHRRFKVLKDQPFSIDDFKAQLKVRQLEAEIQQSQLPDKINECELLKEKIAQMENEEDLVKWYINVMENGVNAKNVIYQYSKQLKKLKRESDSYKKQKDDEISALHKQIEKLSKKNSKLIIRIEPLEQQLKTQQDLVVKPLIEQVSRGEDERQNLLAT